MLTHRLQLGLSRPIRHLRRPLRLLDRLLGLTLSTQELSAVQEACSRSGVRFGAYYHWYLHKAITANRVRRLDKASLLGTVGRMDQTNYSPLDASLSDPRGLLIAIPHHGHYILSIIGIIERLRAKRDVFVFYGSPATHAGNDIFDTLHACLYGDPQSGAHIIHDTRTGMARAIRALQSGATVVIMPDVYKHERDTFSVPFCGRPLSVMLGTAALARRTRSVILPAVSIPVESNPCFTTAFLPVIDPASDGSGDILHHDYRTMVKLFRHFEREMNAQIVYWQYSRSHYIRKADFPSVTPESLKTVADLFFRDPRIHVDTRHPIRLDEQQTRSVE